MCKPQMRRQVCRGFAQCATGLLLLLLEDIDHLNYRPCHHDDHQRNHHCDREHEGQDNQNRLCAADCSLLLLIIFIINSSTLPITITCVPTSSHGGTKLMLKSSQTWVETELVVSCDANLYCLNVFLESITSMVTMVKTSSTWLET